VSKVLDDEEIQRLIDEPKRATAKPRRREKAGHIEIDCEVVGDSENPYVVWARQNIRLDEDFSAGLRLRRRGDEDVILRRYNGSSHSHPNHIEDEHLPPVCHVHEATQRYWARRGRADGYARIATSYTDVRGAVRALLSDCAVSGIAPELLMPTASQGVLPLGRENG